MTRVPRPDAERGSLKWIQRAVEHRSPELERPILARIPQATAIDWRSPLRTDDFAEYRDGAFLKRLGLEALDPALTNFWPARGPQWDALGRSDGGDVLLVEAKAHVGEMCSPGTQASAASRMRIAERLDALAARLNARSDRAPWTEHFYQLANRLAHLSFLRDNGVPAWLVLVNFVGDTERDGPSAAEVWQAAYHVAWHIMGLPRRHALSRFVVEVYPSVASNDARR